MRKNKITSFWEAETCEYCGGPIVEKRVQPAGLGRDVIPERGSIMPEILPEDLQRLVDNELASGHFRSTRELLVEGIRLLQREREEAVKGIQAGLDDIQAGRFQLLEDAFADLRADADS